jgi:hypothetical protein
MALPEVARRLAIAMAVPPPYGCAPLGASEPRTELRALEG